MKSTIYAEEFGFALKAEVVGNGMRFAIVRLGNSPNEGEEIASATIANYRVKSSLLPLLQSAVGMNAENEGR